MPARPAIKKDVTTLLRASDPLNGLDLTEPGVGGALDELGASIVASAVPAHRPRARRPGRRVLALGLTAAAVVIGGGVAAAAVLSAHTGRTMPKAQVPMGGPGEELRLGTPDFRSVALQIASDIPYPDGYRSWRNLVIADADDDSTAYVSSGALHGWFAMSAFCAWVRSWNQAVAAGDKAGAARAAQTIAQAPAWKAVTDEDPHPNPSAANDPGAETGTLFGWLLPYRDAVLAGDRIRVEHLLANGYGDGRCTLYDPTLRAREKAAAQRTRQRATSPTRNEGHAPTAKSGPRP